MKHEGHGVARLNDKTTHGGQVITATGPIAMGLAVTLHGDMTHCPQCKGDFAITPDDVGVKHRGRVVAYDNALTACGARLISSI